MKHRSPGRPSTPNRSPAQELIAQASALDVDLDEKQAAELLAYEELLSTRAIPLGLIGEGDFSSLRKRHILDCLRAVSAVADGDTEGYDLGSGAGLPGIVVAIARPELHMRLVEPRRRRAAFLELAVELLRLPHAGVVQARAEDLADPADICFARALTSLPGCWELTEPLLKPGGRLVYFAGNRVAAGMVPSPGAAFRLLEAPVLESSGPLVIMTRR